MRRWERWLLATLASGVMWMELVCAHVASLVELPLGAAGFYWLAGCTFVAVVAMLREG